MNLGQGIKELRKAKGFKTQKEFAEACKISSNALCYIEMGRVFPKKETIDKICKVLGVPKAYLLFFCLTDEDIQEDKREVFKTLSKPMKELLLS